MLDAAVVPARSTSFILSVVHTVLNYTTHLCPPQCRCPLSVRLIPLGAREGGKAPRADWSPTSLPPSGTHSIGPAKVQHSGGDAPSASTNPYLAEAKLIWPGAATSPTFPGWCTTTVFRRSDVMHLAPHHGRYCVQVFIDRSHSVSPLVTDIVVGLRRSTLCFAHTKHYSSSDNGHPSSLVSPLVCPLFVGSPTHTVVAESVKPANNP